MAWNHSNKSKQSLKTNTGLKEKLFGLPEGTSFPLHILKPEVEMKSTETFYGFRRQNRNHNREGKTFLKAETIILNVPHYTE